MDADQKYIAEQSPEKRVLLEKLRAIVVKTLPRASVSIKWGVPLYEVDGRKICALASFKDHVGINFSHPHRRSSIRSIDSRARARATEC